MAERMINIEGKMFSEATIAEAMKKYCGVEETMHRCGNRYELKGQEYIATRRFVLQLIVIIYV